jgi:L-amino acid N-acyltransferase YncA
MASDVDIVTVDASNVDQYGFFCYKSKPKTAGYRHKRAWLEERFAEGLRIRIVREGGRPAGFIEYVPGEFAWRAVNAPNYLVVHCMWVVGRGKDKGYGSRLLSEAIADAQALGKHGVAVVTSRRPWLTGSALFLKHGFEVTGEAPPSFELLVRSFGDAPRPSFPADWSHRLGLFGRGLTVVRSGQCPYLDATTEKALVVAREAGVSAQVVELATAKEVQAAAPSAYGVFGVVYDGKLLTYNSSGRKEILELLQQTETPGLAL